MPAASDPLALPHTWRPLGARIAGAAAGAALLVVSVFTWLSLDPEAQAAFSTIQRITVVFFGLMAFAAGFALTRSRVVAERDRLVVVNGYRRRELTWPEVVGVHLPSGAPWVTLDLADGGTLSAMGIQGSDGARARTAVRQLRSLADQLTR